MWTTLSLTRKMSISMQTVNLTTPNGAWWPHSGMTSTMSDDGNWAWGGLMMFSSLSGGRPVSKDAEAFSTSVWAEKVPPAASLQRRAPEGHGAVHEGQALCAAPDPWWVEALLSAFQWRHSFWTLALSFFYFFFLQKSLILSGVWKRRSLCEDLDQRTLVLSSVAFMLFC